MASPPHTARHEKKYRGHGQVRFHCHRYKGHTELIIDDPKLQLKGLTWPPQVSGSRYKVGLLEVNRQFTEALILGPSWHDEL